MRGGKPPPITFSASHTPKVGGPRTQAPCLNDRLKPLCESQHGVKKRETPCEAKRRTNTFAPASYQRNTKTDEVRPFDQKSMPDRAQLRGAEKDIVLPFFSKRLIK